MAKPFVVSFVAGSLGMAGLLAVVPTPATAQSCKSSGNLNYVGRTSDSSRSVWLSLTQSGDFALEAAQGNTRVDTFSRDRPGGRITLSPFVSNGSGGTHRLFERGAAANGGDCLVDTQNQQNGVELPPRPPGLIRPPAGITPPIAILPPSLRPRPGGVVPTLPGRPTPPIGTLPPTGVTPGRPSLPNATLPPAGVTPGRPSLPDATLPPTGVTPGRPSLPNATLPPAGITPGRPSLPDATLPPTGVTPGRPSLPDATLPPTGVTPTVPTQPGQTLPPVAPLPTRPDPVQPDPTRPENLAGAPAGTAAGCAAAGGGKLGAAPCDPAVVPPGDIGLQTAPITPGRDLALPSAWNVWTDFQLSRTDDTRNGSAVDGRGSYIGVGIDRLVAGNTVVGLQLQYEQDDTETFSGLVSVDSTTLSVGPYISVLLNEKWSASALLTVGEVTSDVVIGGLTGEVDRTRTTASLSATGQYAWGRIGVRPQASLDYTYTSGKDLQLDGNVNGTPLSVLANVPSGWNGTFIPSVEFSRIFARNGTIFVPFAEIGAIYAFGDAGGILSNDQDGTFHEWMGTARLGARARTGNSLLVEATLGYNSLFENDFDSLDAGLYLYWNF